MAKYSRTFPRTLRRAKVVRGREMAALCSAIASRMTGDLCTFAVYEGHEDVYRVLRWDATGKAVVL